MVEKTLEEDAPLQLLLVEDEPDLRSTLRYNLKRAGYQVVEAQHGQDALERIDAAGSAVDLIVSDVMMPVMDGMALARRLRSMPAFADTPLMFLTAKGEPADRLEGFRVGADDYLTKPFDIEELLARVQVQARRAMMARKLRKQAGGGESASSQVGLPKDLFAKVAEWERRFPQLAAIRRDAIVGSSPRTLSLLREILLRAPGRDPVLIVGETGSGKTGVAEALWRLGPRADKPFRVVNCAELASADAAITLGKLFGYGKGSGLANIPKDGQSGLLQDLDGGTLFLDEIHQLPLSAQAMLLLPVEGRPFNPAVGKGPAQQVDVKFIFATNMDLRSEAVAGRFPSDLYQRLAGSQIRVPALSERREDIPALAQHFLEESKTEFDLLDAVFAPSLMRMLVERNWPGNVRELRSVVRELARRAAFEMESVLTSAHLPEDWEHRPLRTPVATPIPPSTPTPTPAPMPAVTTGEADPQGFWNEVEMPELSALRRHRFKVAAAEAELGLSQKSRTLTNHLRGLCFKALAHRDWNEREAARLVVGRDDEALLDRTVERIQGYLEMVKQHVAEHSTAALFKNLPRDYRKYVEQAIERVRAA
ncbi:MAG: sigma 54-interacting transcriptional regulator [Myxococcota bacterium]